MSPNWFLGIWTPGPGLNIGLGLGLRREKLPPPVVGAVWRNFTPSPFPEGSYPHLPHKKAKNTYLRLLTNVVHKSISRGTQYVTLQKYFPHPSWGIILFCNPTHKTETRTANRWGTTNSKPPGPIIMMGQSQTPTTSQIVFIRLFSVRAQCCCVFLPATVKLRNYAEPKPFWTIFMSETGIIWLFFIQLYRVGLHPKHGWRCSNTNDFHPPGITTMASSTPDILDVNNSCADSWTDCSCHMAGSRRLCKVADEYKYTHCNYAHSSSQFPLLSQVVCFLVFWALQREVTVLLACFVWFNRCMSLWLAAGYCCFEICETANRSWLMYVLEICKCFNCLLTVYCGAEVLACKL